MINSQAWSVLFCLFLLTADTRSPDWRDCFEETNFVCFVDRGDACFRPDDHFLCRRHTCTK